MPNHVHCILVLNNNNNKDDAGSIKRKNNLMSIISPKANSVSTIIRSYKSAVTKHAHRLGFEFEWQPLFHDHIIRKQADYNNIFDYINNNPKNWKKDKFYNNNKST